MEKLFLSLITSLLFLLSFTIKAQEYVVFKSNGNSINIVNNSEKKIKKGNVITQGIVSVKAKDTLLLLDDNGTFYQLYTDKKYNFSEISSYLKLQTEEGFSKKYFSYVWKQMKNEDKTPVHTGNVYRKDRINVLVSPLDSTNIYKNEVQFFWKENTKQEYSYFFLKNDSNNTTSVIKIKGTSLSLFTDNNMLVKGYSYSWGIAYEKFPAFERIKFNSFNFLTKEEYLKEQLKLKPIIEDLKILDYTNNQIKQFLCEYFTVCTE